MKGEKGEIREFFKIGKKEGGSQKYLDKGSIPSIVDNKQTITVKSLGKKTIGVEKLIYGFQHSPIETFNFPKLEIRF